MFWPKGNKYDLFLILMHEGIKTFYVLTYGQETSHEKNPCM